MDEYFYRNIWMWVSFAIKLDSMRNCFVFFCLMAHQPLRDIIQNPPFKRTVVILFNPCLLMGMHKVVYTFT